MKNIIVAITFFSALFFQTNAASAQGLIINQVFAGGPNDNSASVSHSFIELYNPTEATVNLEGWSLQVQNGNGNGTEFPLATEWLKYDFSATDGIAPKTSLLIRMDEVAQNIARYKIDNFDISWTVADGGRLLSNRSYSVALVSNQTLLSKNITSGEIAYVVDLLGAKNTNSKDVSLNYKIAPYDDMSKQKSVRRIDFKNYGNNLTDFESIDYRTTGITNEQLEKYRPRWSGDGEWGIEPPVTPSLPDHLIINQVYGGGKNADGAVSHSFIEIYNPTDVAVTFDDVWSLQYQTNGSAGELVGSRWERLNLVGTILPKHSFLVRANGGKTVNTRYEIYYADQEWLLVISNDSYKFALVNNQTRLLINNPGVAQGVVDLVGATNPPATIDFSEGNPFTNISKQKAARRVNFCDTDNNATDFESIDYRSSGISDNKLIEVRPHSLRDGAWNAGDKLPLPEPPVTTEITFSKPAGLYETAFDLTLDFDVSEGDKSNYEIRYTLDGEDPKAGPGGSPVYNGNLLRMQDLTTLGNAPLSQLPNTSTSNGGATHDAYVNPNPSTVFQGTVVKAQLFAKDGTPVSDVYVSSYFVSSTIFSRYGNMPVISVSTPKAYFFDPNIGIYVKGNGSVANWDNDWERPIHFEMFEQKGNSSERVIAQGMGVRIHGAASRTIAQKTLRFYTRNGLVENRPLLNGSPTIDYDLFTGTKGDVGIKRFQLRGHSNDAHRALLRDPFSAVMAADFENDTEDYRPAIMFLNGEFWGVYQIRERYDDEYLAQHYGPDKNRYETIEDPSTYYYGYTDPLTGQYYNVGGMTLANNGTPEAINHYLTTVAAIDNFIAQKGINTPETYAEIEKYVDIDNLIDYTILRTFIGDNDWVNKARPVDLQTFGKHQLMWRYTAPVNGTKQDGRYRWMHKDGDFAFQGPAGNEGGGNSANTGVHGMGFNSIAVIMDENPENYFFFNRLMLNDIFKEKFINRYMTVMNTTFSITNLNNILYGMKAEIDMAMNEHFLRWSYNNRTYWESEINRISSNLALRTSTDPNKSGITKGLNILAGGNPETLTIRSYGGYVKLNGTDIKPGTPGVNSAENWSGQFHVGLNQKIEAVPTAGESFTKFIVTENSSGNTYESTQRITDVKMVAGGVTVTAVFGDGPPANVYDGLIILQAYGAGASEDGSISHSFIELYNTTDQPISMNGISLQYNGLNEARTALTGWEMIKLSGEIPAHTSYLVRANGQYNTATNRYEIYTIDGDGKKGYDLFWDITLSNRLMMIALVDHQQKINTNNRTAIPGLISSIASYNASADLAFMGANWNYVGNVTKQKAVRRVDFGETLEAISYRSLDSSHPSFNGTEGITDATLLDVRPYSLADGEWPPRLPDLPKKPDGNLNPVIVFSEEAGLFTGNFNLTLTANPVYTIRYTLDGSDPTAPGAPDATGSITKTYSGPIEIRDRTDFAIEGGVILSRQQNTEGELSLAMQTYVRPERGDNFMGTVVKAQLYEGDKPVGKMYINSYYVDANIHTKYGGLPIISISTPFENLFDPVKGIYTNGNNSHPGLKYNYYGEGSDWERPAFFEMFEANGVRVLDQGMGIRTHGGNWNKCNPQKSLRFYARSGNLANGMRITNGKNNVGYDLFQGTAINGKGKPLTSGFTRFILRSAGNDLTDKYNVYLGAFMRDAISSRISRDHFNFETMAYSPAVAFINGEFWGLYNIRQRYDDEFLALAYGGDKNDYTILEGPVLKYVIDINQGTTADSLYFLNLANQVWNMNLADNTNYEHVINNIVDENSLIDYVIIETFIANRDWAASHNNNQRIWRYTGAKDPNVRGHDGKYRWMLYDTDESFGGGADTRYGFPILTTNDQDVLDKLLNNGKENLPFFTKLWENTQFRDKFINRYMDALNTCLQSDVTVPIVSGMEAAIDKVMQADQKIRWNYTLNHTAWQQNVADIKIWLQGRASNDPSIGALPVIVAKHAKNKNLAPLTLKNDGDGYITLNGMELTSQHPGVATDGSFTGNYFVGYNQTLVGVPNGNLDFVKFIVENNSTHEIKNYFEQELILPIPDGGLTVTAVFGVAEYHTVTFLDSDGTPLGTAQVRQGDKATAPQVEDRAGLRLVGWQDENGEAFNLNTLIMGDITLKAVWKNISEIPEAILGPTQYYVAAYSGEANSLPAEVEVRFADGSTGKAPINWDNGAFLAAANYDMATITGGVENVSTTLTAVVEVIPRNIVYFIDAGLKVREGQPERTSSPPYNAVVEKLGDDGRTLYNEVFDKFYNDANDGWGVIRETINSSYIEGVDGDVGLTGHSATDKIVTNYYGWNTFQTINGTFVDGTSYEYDPNLPLYIEYRLNLPKGEYQITTGHYLFCDREEITVFYPDGHYGEMDIEFNGQRVQAPFILKNLGDTRVFTNGFTQDEDGEMIIRFNTTDRDGAIVSFIGVEDITSRQTFNVTFNADNGTPVKIVPVNEGLKVKEPETPVKTGYTFTGWYLDNGTQFDFDTKITEDLTLTALWAPKSIDGIIGAMHRAAYEGEANSLPDTLDVRFDDGITETVAIEWDTQSFMAAKAYDMIDLTGTVSGTALTVTVRFEIIPRNLVYFIDAGLQVGEGENLPQRTSSLAYNAVVQKLGNDGQTLFNEVFDKYYNNASDRWGAIKETISGSYIEMGDNDPGLNGHSPTDKIVTSYYGFNTFQTTDVSHPDYGKPMYVEYRLYLKKGEYKITTGHYMFCPRNEYTIAYDDGHYGEMDVEFNGQRVQAPFILKFLGDTYLWTNAFTQDADGEMVIRFNTTDRDGAIVSFIGVQDMTIRKTFDNIYVAAYADDTAPLPQTIPVQYSNGTSGTVNVNWDYSPLASATDYREITIHGTMTDDGEPITATVNVIPHGLVYYIDAGTADYSNFISLADREAVPPRTVPIGNFAHEPIPGSINANLVPIIPGSAAFDAVAQRVGAGLLNDKSDGFFNGTWGLVAETMDRVAFYNDGKTELQFSRGYAGYNKQRGWDANHPKYMEYQLDLPAGEYIITTGHYAWWGIPDADPDPDPEHPLAGNWPRDIQVWFGPGDGTNNWVADDSWKAPFTPQFDVSLPYFPGGGLIYFDEIGQYAIATHKPYTHSGGLLSVRTEAATLDGAQLSFIGVQEVQQPPKQKHLIINQAYSVGDAVTVPLSHSFVELYNPTSQAVDISSWSLQYSAGGTGWEMLLLEGSIPAGGSYLIRIKNPSTQTARYTIEHYDLEWVLPLLGNPQVSVNNRNFKFALVDKQDKLTVAKPGEAEGVIDLIGAINSSTDVIDAFEGSGPISNITKQRAARRIDFQDTDDNSVDFFSQVYRYPTGYSVPTGITTGTNADGVSDLVISQVRPRSLMDGSWTNGDIFFTIALDPDNGEPVSFVRADYNTPFTKPADPEKDDYEFGGWFRGNTEYDFATPAFRNLTLKAKWNIIAPNTYTVTFDPDNGEAIFTEEVIEGSKVQKPADPVKEGYVFIGWFNGDVKFDFDTPITVPITLTARFSAIMTHADLKIIQAFGGGPNDNSASVSHSFIELYNPTDAAINLDGWSLQVQNGIASGVVATEWLMLEFNNTNIIGAYSSLLIRLDQVANNARYNVANYDISWISGRLLSNRSYSVALVRTQALLSKNITTKEKTYVVDLVGTTNTAPTDQALNYEGTAFDGMSKQKSIRRIELKQPGNNFKDTNVNSADFMGVDYRKVSGSNGIPDEKVAEYRPRWSGDGAWGKYFAVTFDANNGDQNVIVPVEIGKTASKPAEDPMKASSRFQGWFIGDNLFSFDTPITGDITLTAKWGLYGDVDDNNSVNPLDLMKLTQYLSGWEGVAINLLNADVNDDGNVNPLDQFDLTRFLGGFEGYEELPYRRQPISLSMLKSVSSMNSKKDNTPTIRVSNATGKIGDIVDVSINMENNPGLISMRLRVDYDASKLELVGVKNGTILGASTHGNNLNKMPYTLFWPYDINCKSDIVGDGEIAVLQFRIKEGTEETPIVITYNHTDYDIYNYNLQQGYFTVVNGSVSSETVTLLANSLNKPALFAYPNPLQRGSLLNIEGVAAGSLIEVYNLNGVRVYHTIAADGPTSLTLNVPAGIYLVRANNREIKIIVD